METDDILKRIFVNLDKMYVKVDDLCNRTTATETKLSNYLEVQIKNMERRDRNSKIAFSVIGVVFGVYAILKEFV